MVGRVVTKDVKVRSKSRTVIGASVGVIDVAEVDLSLSEVVPDIILSDITPG